MSRLYYVMGTSGRDKDMLINFVKQKLNSSHPTIFAHRYVTKRSETPTENHIVLTPRDFKMRERKQLFSLHWEADGNFYGIGKEINYWMYQGFNVVVNGSREYLPEAIRRYKQLRPILIESNSDFSLHGLNANNIPKDKRAIKENAMNLHEHALIRISHDGPLEKAGKELICIVTGIAKSSLQIH